MTESSRKRLLSRPSQIYIAANVVGTVAVILSIFAVGEWGLFYNQAGITIVLGAVAFFPVYLIISLLFGIGLFIGLVLFNIIRYIFRAFVQDGQSQ
jgi:hypothetical protein